MARDFSFTKNAGIRRAIEKHKRMMWAQGERMLVVSNRKEKEIGFVQRPVEYFSGDGHDLQFALDLHDPPDQRYTKFIHIAATHAGLSPPLVWRCEQQFIDRVIAFADFEAMLPRPISCGCGLIAAEVLVVFFEETEESVEFPMWRAVLQVPASVKTKQLSKKVDKGTILYATDLDNVREIEAACASLVSAPTPDILERLGAPIRLVKMRPCAKR